MATQSTEQPKIGKILQTILLVSLAITVPCLEWGVFGWVHVFLPLLAFYLLSKFGGFIGRRLLLSAVTVSLIIHLITRNFDLFIFSAALLFSGYILYCSAEHQDSPAISGLKSALTLAGGWIVVMAVSSFGADVSAYGQLVGTLDEGVGEALEYYRQSDTISADTLVMLEATLHQMKVIVPIIMPAILGSLVLFITWFTMVLGNMLVLKSFGIAPWNRYRYWQLPEKLIWAIIVGGALALLPFPLFRGLGINSLILLSIVYCFQGLAIGVFFMNKWNVPLLIRSFFYVMIVFQSFGTLILLIFGIADIWFDFRKLKPNTIDGTEI